MSNMAFQLVRKEKDGEGHRFAANFQYLGAYDQETLAALETFPGEFDSAGALNGKIHNYNNDGQHLELVENYLQVKADPSLLSWCKLNNIHISQALEQMDPSYRYAGDDAFRGTTALERQFARFGFLRPRGGKLSIVNDFKLSAAIANTPANQLYFPTYQSQALFWDPILDQDLDPNMLLAGTTTSKERTFKHIRVDDSGFRHRRIPPQGIGEQSEVPVSNITTYGFAGNMIKHGVGYSYSREFAMFTDFDVADMAFARSRIKERIAYFNHILDTILNGNTYYAITNACSSVTAFSLDPSAISGDGELSFYAQLMHLYSMRPYKPMAFCNVSTYHSFLQAIPPKNMVDTEILRALVGMKGYPDMPKPVNREFLQFTPDVKVVPDTSMPNNIILYMDPRYTVARKVLAGGEWSDLAYNVELGRYKQIYQIYDGIEALPSMRDAAKVLSLTIS